MLSDCLSKTQVYAKAKAKVYGLMPVRCRKVKEGADSFDEALTEAPVNDGFNYKSPKVAKFLVR